MHIASHGTVFVCLMLQSFKSLASLTVPYIKPMMLGRTFDYSKSLVGNDIYPASIQSQLATASHHLIHIKYSVIKEAKDIRDVLDVSGQLSCQVMAGLLDIKGRGSYLKSSSESGNFVEVLAKISFQTVTKSIPSGVKPNSGWDTKPNIIGRHFVRSITYGGFLIASLRFKAKSEEDLEKISAGVEADLNTATLKVGVKGQFDMLASSVKDMSTLTITYTATTPLTTVPTDLESLVKAITDFPEVVKQVNNGTGVPIDAEIVELCHIGSQNLMFSLNGPVQAALTALESMYFDLMATEDAIKKFLQNNPEISNTCEKQLGAFYQKIFNKTNLFNNVIANIELNDHSSIPSSQKGVAQFKKAFDAYKEGGMILPRKFLRQFYLLSEKIMMTNDERTKMATEAKKLEEDVKITNSAFQKYLSIDDLSSSTILAEDATYLPQIKTWLPDKCWNLCYRASDNGWDANTFHSRCDYEGPTMTIIKTDQNFIFGGYADKSWGGPERYVPSEESFIFSLRNKDSLPPFKAPLYKNQQQAIHTNPNQGPGFSKDITITSMGPPATGGGQFGYAYKPPTGYTEKTDKTTNLLAGGSSYRPSEVEVYYLR